MANIKPIDQASDKWIRRAAVAGPDYQKGIENPKADWETASIEASGNYKAGVIAAANAGRFERGIKIAGTAKWKRNAMAKGPNRFAEGVALAQDDWEKGFGPYHSVIAALKLPPRGPKGSPANMQRVAAVAMALRSLKEKKGTR